MIALLASMCLVAPSSTVFPFNDGDRVVVLGATLVEREQQYGHVEAAILLANRDKKLIVRNLGWSGDTVYGDARAGFDNAAKGYERLVTLTKELKPTVIVIAYGLNESFDGDAGLPRFEKGYAKLLDDLAVTKARFALVTVPGVEYAPGVSGNELSRRDARLKLYNNVTRTLAKKQNHTLIDLQDMLSKVRSPGPFTENGVHYGANGYQMLATSFTSENAVRSTTPELLSLIKAKNELFFHRWRPQNETYLFGFRKHEQGKNAAEIVQFDPLIEEAEKKINDYLKAMPRK